MDSGKNYIIGIFDNESKLLKGIKNIKEAGIRIQDVYTPYPVHGLDEALGYKRSRLPIAAFLFGLTGTALALVLQFWTMGVDWPMIIGGKDYAPLPSFIPVTFELTVLLSALGMVGTFMIISDLKPYKKPRIYDIRSTDDKYVMAIDLARNKLEKEKINKSLNENGALEVYYKDFK